MHIKYIYLYILKEALLMWPYFSEELSSQIRTHEVELLQLLDSSNGNFNCLVV